ncbi:MAG: acetyl-CoA hydrolase/transferase C-terminal domain-containing protein [Planctomycetota bacterium]|nr:acetyl-CoA hydrolase/transferase C-terminal domain-containing protein [Planctomycetota bacterium]
MMSLVATPAEAVALIKSGMNIFVHGSVATPAPLLDALAARKDLSDVTLYHLHTDATASFVSPEAEGRIRSCSFFTGPMVRAAVQAGKADFLPVFLSDVPHLIYTGRVRIDAALLQLSPQDRHGLHTLGTSCDAARAAADVAPLVIAEINTQMPRTMGNTVVNRKRLSAWVETDRALPSHPPGESGPIEAAIGERIAQLVEDGSTLQMGIGAIPDAVLARLGNKHDLGVHSEMFSDGLIPLIQGGVVTNRFKQVHPGRTVTSFISGSRKLYDFVHDNPLVEFHACDRTNDTALIRRNPKVTAINSALEVDLTGQVCADSIGHKIYSGIGGQMDFIRGAALSHGGKPIIALPSTAAGGKISRISAELTPGAGVVTTRGHVHWVVTEHGAVNLYGLTLRQRGEALISIAHPDFRAELARKLNQTRHYSVGV